MLSSRENETLVENAILFHTYAISVFYLIKCGKAHTFSLILIITFYLNSLIGFAAEQLNILLSPEDQQCALMNVSLVPYLLRPTRYIASWVNSEQVLLDASLTAWSYRNSWRDDPSPETKLCIY